jgi:hypothetical protein
MGLLHKIKTNVILSGAPPRNFLRVIGLNRRTVEWTLEAKRRVSVAQRPIKTRS